MITKDDNSEIKLAKKCRDKILMCLGKKEVSDVEAKDLSNCLDKNKECSALKKLDSGSVISNEYCEKLYGRKL